MSLNGITLCCDKWEAEVLPLFGANLISLKKNGFPILRTPESLEQLNKAPCLYGNPLLFPPNRTKDGKFSFMGVEYSLPINEPLYGNHLHGRFYNAPFQVKAVSRTGMVCSLQNRGELFPFFFTMQVTFELDAKGLTQRIEIYNDGECSMPVLLGFHTSFNAPEQFSVPIGKRWEADERHLPTGSLSSLNSSELLYVKGCKPEGKIITGYYTAEGQTARIGAASYESSPEFTQWILYNQGGGKGYLCVEPQSGCVNGLNIPGEYRTLPAGESAHYWLRFTMD